MNPEDHGGRFWEVLRGWSGDGVVTRFDSPTGTWMFVALHSGVLGSPVGGCRMKAYDHPVDGLVDAMRLAEGMTAKWATIGLPFGGGKAVLAVPGPLEGTARRAVFTGFARLLNTMDGAFRTGEDLGTTPSDMAMLAQLTPHVMGGHGGGPGDPGPYTALGVFEGIRAALRAKFGDDELAGRSVLIQGVGDVGAPLAGLIREAGGSVLVSDLDDERVRIFGRELGASVVAPDQVYSTPCDVYAPCAVGATLNSRTIPELACEIVAGSANNQLLKPSDADRLASRDILYAPDYVINGGGALAFGLMHQGMSDEAELRSRVRGIGEALDDIFARAREDGITPSAAADARVARILENAS